MFFSLIHGKRSTIPAMWKKRFKIICFSDGNTLLYDTMIKTWFGWISFTVLYNTLILHVLSDPVNQKSRAYDRIYQYCEVEGCRKDRIVITEVCEGESNKWCDALRAVACRSSVMPVAAI